MTNRSAASSYAPAREKLDLFEELSSRVIGQDEAIKEIIPALHVFNAGLSPDRRPAGIFLLAGMTGVGKALPNNTKVLTPDGWKPIGGLSVGNLVIGSAGEPTYVTGVYPQGTRMVSKLTLSDNSSVLCDQEHLWQVSRMSHGIPKTKVLSTAELRRHDKIPILSAPVNFHKPAPAIPPYTLGYLVGNGNLGQPGRRVGYSVSNTDHDHVTARITAEGFTTRSRQKAGCFYVTILEDFSAELVSMNLRCLSYDKAIPETVKRAPVSYRIAFLQGLMDSDGSVSPTRNKITLSTVSPVLAADVQEFVECLGGSCSYSGYDRPGRKNREFHVRVSLPESIQPFSLPRKQNRIKPGRCFGPRRSVMSVDVVGYTDCTCISVAAEDSLYVTEHCIVTHNTETVEALADVIHGSRTAYLRIDCGEYQMDHEVAKLIGAPPGYLGHRETQPLLTQHRLSSVTSDRSRVSIVLFDEVEKASPSLNRLLLGVLDKGTLRLGDNTSVTFENSIIFMTSNLGAEAMSKVRGDVIGFYNKTGDAEQHQRKFQAVVEGATKKQFSPEFINRLDKVVSYRPLTAEHVSKILDLQIAGLNKHIGSRLGARSFTIALTPGAREWLISRGYSDRFGARELKRVLHRHVMEPLAGYVTDGRVRSGAYIKVQCADDKLVFAQRMVEE